jgi:hypothetical protein
VQKGLRAKKHMALATDEKTVAHILSMLSMLSIHECVNCLHRCYSIVYRACSTPLWHRLIDQFMNSMYN